MNEIYHSVQSHATVQVKIEGSRFIADVLYLVPNVPLGTRIEIISTSHISEKQSFKQRIFPNRVWSTTRRGTR